MTRLYVDLHIHSCLSPCGDELMTPNNIARMAMLKELDAVALTDHNSGKNLPAMAEACREAGITLLPGMELTTREEAHLLAYFPEVKLATAFSDEIYEFLPPVKNRPSLFGEQLIMDGEDEIVGHEEKLLISALNLSIDELIDRIHAAGGAAVPAHINRGSNGLLNALGFLPPGIRADALEVTRELACAADLSPWRVTHASDAHYLENISERDYCIEARENSARAIFDWILGVEA